MYKKVNVLGFRLLDNTSKAHQVLYETLIDIFIFFYYFYLIDKMMNGLIKKDISGIKNGYTKRGNMAHMATYLICERC